MKFLILSFILSLQAYTQTNNSLLCKFENGHFFVKKPNGSTIKKFIGNFRSVEFACNKNLGGILAGQIFLVTDGSDFIQEELAVPYNKSQHSLLIGESIIGTFNKNYLFASNGKKFSKQEFDKRYSKKEFIHIKAKRNIIGGMVGPIFSISNGVVTQTGSLGFKNDSTIPNVKVHENIVGVYWQKTFVAANMTNLTQRKLNDTDDNKAKIVAFENRVALIHGDHFYASDGKKSIRKYFDNFNLDSIQLQSSEHLAAAYIDPYFVVVDSKKLVIKTEVVEKKGKLIILDNIAANYLTQDYLYRYSIKTGLFSEIPISRATYESIRSRHLRQRKDHPRL